MNNKQTIKIVNSNTPKHITVKIEQNIDTLNFLSLNLKTDDIYESFNSDYGVVIGRVIANNGVGVPNAKVSIFIPLDENDYNDGSIISVYPYKTPRDKNIYGKRYNLLPRVGEIDPDTGEIKPKQPFGSFPTKEEIVTNPTYLEIYKKYYKYSTITNESGDYMIFGVPIGTQIVHMSCDITDIGKYSMTPATMVKNLGYSETYFDETLTYIKPSNDLDDLPNIDTQEISVDVIPFWGDKENFEIGLTQVDFRIRAELITTFILFGSIFTDGDNNMWGTTEDSHYSGSRRAIELYIAKHDDETPYMGSKRTGIVTEKIYYYPSEITDYDIDNDLADPKVHMRVLDKSQYTYFKENGDFVFIIPCNRKKIITLEDGSVKLVPDDYPGGVFTEFRGFVTFEIKPENLHLNISDDDGADTEFRALRYRIKIPQKAIKGHTFTENENQYTEEWRKQNFIFKYNNMYSVAKFHGTNWNIEDDDSEYDNSAGTFNDGFFDFEKLNVGNETDYYVTRNVGIIKSNYYTGVTNTYDDFPYNIDRSSNNDLLFGGNWLNFTLYLPQVAYAANGWSYIKGMHTNTNLTANPKSFTYVDDNLQYIAAYEFNTKWFARSDLHYTTFVEVDKGDVINILSDNTLKTKKGFTSDDINFTLKGNYINGENVENVPHDFSHQRLGGAGLINATPGNSVDTKYYFYRGFKESDIFKFLNDLKLL